MACKTNLLPQIPSKNVKALLQSLSEVSLESIESVVGMSQKTLDKQFDPIVLTTIFSLVQGEC